MQQLNKKQMNKWIWAILAVVLALVIAGTFLLLFLRKEPQPEFVFRYAENQAADYPTSQGAYLFAQLVEERSEGRIQILVYTAGSLGREQDVIRQMQYGGIDFARVSISQLAGMVPKLNVLQMPYLYRDSEHMWAVLDGDIGEEFLEEIGEQKLIGLSWYDAGTRNFYNSVKPIRSLEDMKGMRIRVQESSLMQDMVESLGAISVPLSYEEVYSAIEVGSVDGAENNWPSYESMLHSEVAKYWTQDEHTRVPEIQMCSEQVWELLSEEDREMIREAAQESAIYERQLWAEREESMRESAVEKGTQVVVLSSAEKQRFRDAMEDIYARYCKDYMDLVAKISSVRE